MAKCQWLLFLGIIDYEITFENVIKTINYVEFFYRTGAGTPGVTYDYGYGRAYDTTKTYYQQAPSTATYAAAAQPYDTTAQTAAKV